MSDHSGTGKPQRVLLLDWKGTLGLLEDPAAFIKTLQVQGDFCVLSSFGGCPSETRRLFNMIHSKMGSRHDLMVDLDHYGVITKEIVVVDDSIWAAFDHVDAAFYEKQTGVPWCFHHVQGIPSLKQLVSSEVPHP